MTDKPEHPCCRNTDRIVIGVDEVGRGSLIGEVTAAAVAFHSPLPVGMKDSKKICENKRNAFNLQIRETAHVAIGTCTLAEIDEHGILQATMVAMERAWMQIPAEVRAIALTIVDGDRMPKMTGDIELMPRADELCPTVSAASIVAKVYRDGIITQLHQDHPQYGWDRNKGYGTKEHVGAIHEYGPTPQHRSGFSPIKQILRERRKEMKEKAG